MKALTIKEHTIDTDKLYTWLLILLSLIYAAGVVIGNFSKPLWYDEAWRSDLVSQGKFNTAYSHAPVTIGYYLIAKFVDLFSQTNFSQRLLTYMALAILPLVVYVFCKTFFNKPFARLMVIMTFLSGYIIENAAVNKPYLFDIICTLLLMAAYRWLLEGKLKPIYFILMSIGFSLISLATLFVLPAIGARLLYRCFKTKEIDRTTFVYWTASCLIVIGLELKLFIKPQIRSLLGEHWSGLFLTGGLTRIVTGVFDNIANIFGFHIGAVSSSPNIEIANIFWNTPQLKIFGVPVIGVSDIFSTLFLLVFIYGLYKLITKRSELPLIILIAFVIELLTALIRKWPFGDARSNIFSLFLLYIVFVYGAYSLITYAIKSPKVLKLTALSISAAIIILLLPYSSLVNLMNGHTTLDQPEIGIQSNAVYVAQHSQKDDYILVNNSIGPLGFQYYYQYSSYTKQYRDKETSHVFYSYSPSNPLVLPNLTKYTPRTVWVITEDSYPGSLVTKSISSIKSHGYKETGRFAYDKVLSQEFTLSN